METKTYYYDFRINQKNLGYFEIRFQKDQIYQNVKFHDAAEVYENPFYLKLEAGKIVAFKKGDRDWIPLEKYGANYFPSSAYPLLLGQVSDRFEYFQINEESGEAEGRVVLEKSGSIINEFRERKLIRSFVMENDFPVEINWGGAVSKIKKSFAEAIAGSPFEV